MDKSYKLFIHLVDASTREIVSQVDTVPGNWRYPTFWWEKGELVEDVVEMSMVDVPAGAFELLVGWYDLDSAERLSVTGNSVKILPDYAILLEAIQR